MKRELNSTRGRLLATLVLLTGACGGNSPAAPVPPGPASITRVSAESKQGTVAGVTAAAPTVVVRDAAGQPVREATVAFTVVAGGGFVASEQVTTDANGRAFTTWYLGPEPGTGHRLRATVGAHTVEFTATAAPLQSGAQYFGANQWVEMIPGDLPIIISAPHGGSIEPSHIPTRTGNVTVVRDVNTQELAHDIAAALRARTGRSPTLVIMRLHRRKIDANREIVEATLGNPHMQVAWHEFHTFIEAARARLVAAQTPGFYIDLHGHAHDIPRLEWGYLITATELSWPDDALNSQQMIDQSSLRALVLRSGARHTDLLRGPNSLGALLESRGFPSVPSPSVLHPGSAPFFSGGYNTRRHASRDGNLIAGVQLEAHSPGVRDTQANRTRFAAELADALITYFDTWYGVSLEPAAERAPIPVRTRLQRSAR